MAEAVEAAGVPYRLDVNGAGQLGHSFVQTSTMDGERWSTYRYSSTSSSPPPRLTASSNEPPPAGATSCPHSAGPTCASRRSPRPAGSCWRSRRTRASSRVPWASSTRTPRGRYVRGLLLHAVPPPPLRAYRLMQLCASAGARRQGHEGGGGVRGRRPLAAAPHAVGHRAGRAAAGTPRNQSRGGTTRPATRQARFAISDIAPGPLRQQQVPLPRHPDLSAPSVAVLHCPRTRPPGAQPTAVLVALMEQPQALDRKPT